MKIVIRAGGVGTRLWPVSREKKPKQLNALISNKTMLQETIERVLPITNPKNIYVSTGKISEKVVRKELGAVIESNLIVEPARRDTAAAVGLESILIYKNDPDAIIASIGSDAQIKDVNKFQESLKKAEKIIKKHPNHILTIGIKPDKPDTGYGYIELDKEIERDVFKVNKFKEKPKEKQAINYLKKGNYLWNANMFVWRAKTVLDLFRMHAPDIYKDLEKISRNPKALSKIYPQIRKTSIDYAVIEKTNKILSIKGDFGWNDIGDWSRLKDELALNEKSNYIKSKNHIDSDSKNCLVYNETEKLITTIGLENIIIVQTDDALLVCDKYSAADVKKITDELKKKNKKYL